MTKKVEDSANRMKNSVVELDDVAKIVANLLVEKPPSPEAVLLCDLNGVVIKCSLQSVEIFLADVNNHRVSELLHFSDEDWRAVIASAPCMERTVVTMVKPYNAPSFPVEITTMRLADTPPTVPRILIIIRSAMQFRDVAERAQSALDHMLFGSAGCVGVHFFNPAINASTSLEYKTA